MRSTEKLLADDTILCSKDDLETVQNMKLLLCIYEKMFGLKINFSKSEVLMISHDDQKAMQLANVMNCSTGVWPIKYLEVPVARSRLHVSDWVSLVGKLMKRLEGWQGSPLSIGGRITLINACLSSIPTYCMSMYLLPKTIIKKMDSVRKRFFGQEGGTERKYHLVKCAKVLTPKQKRGLRVKDLRRMNISLLCKWWW
jgi:hypothetical protein